jgi:hypothetical protein
LGTAQANSLRYPISKISRTGGVAQVVECLLCKFEGLNLNPGLTKQNKTKQKNEQTKKENSHKGFRVVARNRITVRNRHRYS